MLLQVFKPGFNLMNHREKFEIKFGQRKVQKTMYCQDVIESSEVNVCHFLPNIRPLQFRLLCQRVDVSQVNSVVTRY